MVTDAENELRQKVIELKGHEKSLVCHYYICLKKIQTKNLFPTGRTGQTGFFECFGLYFFEINIMMAIRVFILFRI
jgi:hypothetical protein